VPGQSITIVPVRRAQGAPGSLNAEQLSRWARFLCGPQLLHNLHKTRARTPRYGTDSPLRGGVSPLNDGGV